VIKSADHYTISERESYGGNRTITSQADAKRKWWRLALTYHDNGRPLIMEYSYWQECLWLSLLISSGVRRAQLEPCSAHQFINDFKTYEARSMKRASDSSISKSSSLEVCPQTFLFADSTSWNLRPELHGHRSFLPSFSINSFSPWTTLRPRL